MITIEPLDPVTKSEGFEDWLMDHGVEPNFCYKLEVWEKHMLAYCFSKDEKGKKYYNKEKEEIAVEEPRSIALKYAIPGAFSKDKR